MRGVIIHAAKDLRIEETPDPALGRNDVRVRIRMGGSRGSDLHYYNQAGSGFIRLKESIALRHEVAGVVGELGSEVSHLTIGARVAVNPSRHRGHCKNCEEGLTNHCLDMRFMGSAFRESFVVDAAQAIPIADSVSMEEASMNRGEWT